MSDTGVEQPGEDIRSILSQAVTAAETAAEPAGEAKPAEATPAPEETERPASGRARGADGKFVANEGETEAVETPDVPETPETVEAEEVETDPKVEEPPAEVPHHWSQADKDMIAKLPKANQAEVVERIKKIHDGLTPKLQRAAQMEKEFAPIVEMFAPHVEGLRQRNQTPADVIKAWGNVEMELQRGGQGAASRVAGIIKAYKVDPGIVAQYLMGEQPTSGASPANGTQRIAEVPPELMRELSDLKQRVNAREQSEYAARQASISQTIDNFISEKDATGALKHPFYSEVERDMEVLARIEISQGKTPDVADLYDRAVYANRETRTKLLAAQEAEVRRKAAAERKAKAVAAQNAGSSVAGSPGSGQSPSANRSGARSLREELEANVAEHDARA